MKNERYNIEIKEGSYVPRRDQKFSKLQGIFLENLVELP